MANRRLFPLFVLSLVGCEPLVVSLPTPPSTTETPRSHPPGAGTVTGRWQWTGPVPTVPRVQVTRTRDRMSTVVELPNPYQPMITNGNLTSGVIELKPKLPFASKPWPTQTVQMTISDDGFDPRGPILLPVGGSITFRSQKAGIAGVRGRGADTFSRLIPKADEVTEHTFDRPGRVELSMVSGEFWARADVYVSQYPWMTSPQPDGTFRFDQVPPGEYELISTHPNWQVVGHERDPETGALVRWRYGKPLIVASKLIATDGGVTEANLVTAATDFTN